MRPAAMNLHTPVAIGLLCLQCGHYDCGGVGASTKNVDHVAPLENWLRNIRDVYRLHQKELDSIDDPEKRHRRLVELNVIEQCVNLYKTGSVQRRYMDKTLPYSSPRIHACVFDPKDGILRPLDVDFNKVRLILLPLKRIITRL